MATLTRTTAKAIHPQKVEKPRKRKQKDQDAVFRATAAVLLRNGHRKLRTLDIADEAGIKESTLFRTYGKMDDLLAGTDNWAWTQVVQAVIDASFATPQADPKRALLVDTNAIWDLRNDEKSRLAASFAFLFFRRKNEIEIEPSEAELQFTRRLNYQCEQIISEGAEAGSAGLLTTLLLNYLATVWLTWETMPRKEVDTFGAHDLRPEEAQLGVLMLIERFGESAGM